MEQPAQVAEIALAPAGCSGGVGVRARPWRGSRSSAAAASAGLTVLSLNDLGTRTDLSGGTGTTLEASVAPEAVVLGRGRQPGMLAELVGGATVVEEWSGAASSAGSVVRGDAQPTWWWS